MEKTLKNLKIERDKRYGVGKRVGDNVWFEKSYIEEVIPNKTIEKIENLLENLSTKEKEHITKSNIVRYSPKENSIAFIQSDDFNKENEPTVGDSLLLKLKTSEVKLTKKSSNPLIYHHKWLMVRDDYKGFDLEESKKRSIQWKTLLGNDKITSSKIGRKDFWEKWLQNNGLSEKIWDYSGTNQSATSAKTSINNNKLPAGFNKAMKLNLFEKGGINLDIGGGAFDNATKELEKYDTTNYIYDPYNRTEEHNKLVIKSVENGQADTVTIHNVLNVIKEDSIKEKLIKQAKNAIKDDGILMVTVYEGEKKQQLEGGRQTGKDQWQEFKKIDEYLPIIKKHFPNIVIKNKMIIASKNPNLNINNKIQEKTNKISQK